VLDSRVRIAPETLPRSPLSDPSVQDVMPKRTLDVGTIRHEMKHLCVFIEQFPSGGRTTSSKDPPPSASNPECSPSTHLSSLPLITFHVPHGLEHNVLSLHFNSFDSAVSLRLFPQTSGADGG
jgi:hypothetical protein